MADSGGMIDPSIFEGLQTKIDEDKAVRDVSEPQGNHRRRRTE